MKDKKEIKTWNYDVNEIEYFGKEFWFFVINHCGIMVLTILSFFIWRKPETSVLIGIGFMVLNLAWVIISLNLIHKHNMTTMDLVHKHNMYVIRKEEK